ncbi:hypothetical protein E2562_038581 [Oryza meyeriana var. granulata]|uniref:Uncharacterized protein n=1 Tax=Oryza meyeriana var. granulata TaxID=110450 RepID=A0A6G1DVP0_9ORYZ|nr:hypothetical protein E2562_038581 [Oryza meyeriana var. granulata]
MDLFKLEAWTMDPNLIPKEVTLMIEEREPLREDVDDPIFGHLPLLLCEKKMLNYKVLIHVVKVEDYGDESSSEEGSFPSSDGDTGHAGAPSLASFAGDQEEGAHTCSQLLAPANQGKIPPLQRESAKVNAQACLVEVERFQTLGPVMLVAQEPHGTEMGGCLPLVATDGIKPPTHGLLIVGVALGEFWPSCVRGGPEAMSAAFEGRQSRGTSDGHYCCSWPTTSSLINGRCQTWPGPVSKSNPRAPTAHSPDASSVAAELPAEVASPKRAIGSKGQQAGNAGPKQHQPSTTLSDDLSWLDHA